MHPTAATGPLLIDSNGSPPLLTPILGRAGERAVRPWARPAHPAIIHWVPERPADTLSNGDILKVYPRQWLWALDAFARLIDGGDHDGDDGHGGEQATPRSALATPRRHGLATKSATLKGVRPGLVPRPAFDAPPGRSDAVAAAVDLPLPDRVDTPSDVALVAVDAGPLNEDVETDAPDDVHRLGGYRTPEWAESLATALVAADRARRTGQAFRVDAPPDARSVAAAFMLEATACGVPRDDLLALWNEIVGGCSWAERLELVLSLRSDDDGAVGPEDVARIAARRLGIDPLDDAEVLYGLLDFTGWDRDICRLALKSWCNGPLGGRDGLSAIAVRQLLEHCCELSRNARGEDRDAFRALASVLDRTGDMERLRDLANRHYLLDPVRSLLVLARVECEEKGRREAGRTLIERAEHLPPGTPDALVLQEEALQYVGADDALRA